VLKIYGVPISVHTRKVIVVAIAKGLPYEVIPVVPVMPDNPPANWRELSPAGKIPALTDGDFTIADSAAICGYLERLHADRPVYPQSPREYGRALSLEQYAGILFRDVVQPLFYEVFVRPKVHNVPTDQGKIDAVLTKSVPEIFGYLDGIAAGEFLAGKAMSVADIAVASNLITYQYIGFDPYRSRFPRLSALVDRVIQQPAMREALRREQGIVAGGLAPRDRKDRSFSGGERRHPGRAEPRILSPAARP
jgi:glutathione S-transferase